eukprot:scaffold127860_cov27-Attheya_sp.AAC.1
MLHLFHELLETLHLFSHSKGGSTFRGAFARSAAQVPGMRVRVRLAPRGWVARGSELGATTIGATAAAAAAPSYWPGEPPVNGAVRWPS